MHRYGENVHCSLVGFETNSSLLYLLMVPECSVWPV